MLTRRASSAQLLEHFQVRRSICRILQRAPVQAKIIRDVRRMEFAVADGEVRVFRNGLPSSNTAAVRRYRRWEEMAESTTKVMCPTCLLQ